jgi:hypothetical protein
MSTEKRKNEVQKYWLQINRIHKELAWMSYDPNLGLKEEYKAAIEIIEKIKSSLNEKMKE